MRNKSRDDETHAEHFFVPSEIMGILFGRNGIALLIFLNVDHLEKMKQILLTAIVFLASAHFVAAQTASTKTQPLTVGSIAPDFTLSDADGNKVTLSSLKKPAVLVFYRGYW